jgi:pre-mRNA-splicing helicase BRR2
MTPLRQFKGVPPEVVREAAGKQFVSFVFNDIARSTKRSPKSLGIATSTSPHPGIGELLGIPNAGWLSIALSTLSPSFSMYLHTSIIICKLTFPNRLQAQVQLITRSLLRIDLSIVPDFRWDEKVHGTAETFIILVQDVDVDVILFHDTFVLRQRYAEDAYNASLTVPMFEPAPANQYISDISDCWLHWLHAETHLPISFQHLILPKKFPKPTPLLDLHATSTFRFAQQRVRGDIYAHYPNIQQNPDSSRLYASTRTRSYRKWKDDCRRICKEWQAKFGNL